VSFRILILWLCHVCSHWGLKLDGGKGDFADPLWRRKTAHFSTYQYITLVPHKSLMHHDIKQFILSHNFYLFFPIYNRKDFEIFKLLRKFLIFLKIPPLKAENCSIWYIIVHNLKCIMMLKKIFYHNFYLFFPICNRKDFEKFSLLRKYLIVLKFPCWWRKTGDFTT
jgi:hypothetical protein